MFQDISRIQEKLEARKTTLFRYAYTLQPVPVVVGPIDSIRQCFIVLDNFRWEVDSPLEAVLGVLKICFGVGAEYPAESRHIWVFLQRVVFKINTTNDFTRGLKSQLAARLEDFKNFCDNNNN